MPRPALHDTDALLDAARELVIETGPRAVGIRDIATRSGAPSGSLYHRFGSRDNVLARAWLRAVHRFQAGFVPALEIEDGRAAVAAAVRWSAAFARSRSADTQLLLRFGRDDLLDDAPAPELAAELAAVNASLERAVRALARRLFGTASRANVERTTYAVVDLPYAVLRRHLLAGTLDGATVTGLRSAALAIVDEKEAIG
jgi:AcrR family transcriptional regulator